MMTLYTVVFDMSNKNELVFILKIRHVWLVAFFSRLWQCVRKPIDAIKYSVVNECRHLK